jgi:hypothetical protein
MLSFIVGVDVAVNDIKVFSVAMEMKQWFPFTLLSSYRVFRTAVKQYVLRILSLSVFLSSLSGMQIASFLGRILLSSVTCLAVPYFTL